MPISNEEWNNGRTAGTLKSQILAFLQGNQKPLTVSEIFSGLGYSNELNLKNLIAGLAIQMELDDLVEEGTVEAKTIKQPTEVQVYYKAVAGKVLF